jgi:hypothetical protein
MDPIRSLLVEAKTLWVLGMPLFLPSFVFLLSPTITVGFSLDHRLVWLGFTYIWSLKAHYFIVVARYLAHYNELGKLIIIILGSGCAG